LAQLSRAFSSEHCADDEELTCANVSHSLVDQASCGVGEPLKQQVGEERPLGIVARRRLRALAV
jgi:hypothetical protein